MTALAVALSTALGVGYVPVAPGTFGSAVGLLLWWVLPQSDAVRVASILIVFAAGAWSGTIAERHFHTADPRHVVIDEVLGMLITLLFNPVGWTGAVLGFLLFRVADIVKPFPARRLEALHGGLGIMADDAAAAVYSNIALRICVILASTIGWRL
jgi:phosphatidylglycerophosphatase A